MQAANDGIAVSGNRFKAGSVEHIDVAATVAGQAAMLELSGEDCDCSSLRSDHLGEILLGKLQLIEAVLVLRHQQPANQPLFGAVETVASRDLGQDNCLFLHKLEDAPTDLFRAIKRLLQNREWDSEAVAGKLHHAPAGHEGRTKQLQRADHAFMADEADFSDLAVDHRGDDGSQTRGKKKGVARGGSGVVEHGVE